MGRKRHTSEQIITALPGGHRSQMTPCRCFKTCATLGLDSVLEAIFNQNGALKDSQISA